MHVQHTRVLSGLSLTGDRLNPERCSPGITFNFANYLEFEWLDSSLRQEMGRLLRERGADDL